jgi:hypothetical protein
MTVQMPVVDPSCQTQTLPRGEMLTHLCLCFHVCLDVAILAFHPDPSELMESKRGTPQQMLRQALIVEAPETGGNGQMSPSASFPQQVRDSPLPAHVRRTQIEVQAGRNSARVRELSQENASPFQYDEDLTEGHYSRGVENPGYIPMFTGSPMRSASLNMEADRVVPLPSTTARKNITQRRSRDRGTNEGDVPPSSSLLSRRPRSRSKDRRYSMESEGLNQMADCERQDWRPAVAWSRPRNQLSPSPDVVKAECEYQDWRSTSAKFQPQRQLPPEERQSSLPPFVGARELGRHSDYDDAFQDQDSDSGSQESSVDMDFNASFLREYIPSEKTHPILHQHLTRLWYDRQEAVRGLGDALAADDSVRFGILQGQIENLNLAMHEELRTARLTDPCLRKGKSESSSCSSQSSGKKYRSIDSLPVVEPVGKLLRKTSWKETDEENSTRRKNKWLETDEENFEIILSYQGVEASRTVNGHMPTRILFVMARSYLQMEFCFKISDITEFDLMYDDQLLLPEGILGTIPVLANTVVFIQYPRTQRSPASRNVPIRNSKPFLPRNLHGKNMPTDQPKDESPFRQTMSPSSSHARTTNPPRPDEDLYASPVGTSLDSRSYDKIRQSFKCPRFTGQPKDWKPWDKGFKRYLAIWELDYVLDPSFFDHLPLTFEQRRDNKLIYFVIEDSVQGSPLASSYVKQVPLHNGFEAYYTLHDGYVFAGTTTSTILLNELSNFRFLPNETPTALCLRLDKLFQELKLLPGDAAVTFNDTQQIGYLINALRHESEWDTVSSAITSAQIQGNLTFRQACDELRVRCEVSRAHDLMDSSVKGKKIKGFAGKVTDDVTTVAEHVSEKVIGLISSMSKRQNIEIHELPATGKKEKKKFEKLECLAADCDEMTSYPLCPLHYHSLVSAKTPILKLRSDYGNAIFDSSTSLIVYPPKTPASRLPGASPIKKGKALATVN